MRLTSCVVAGSLLLAASLPSRAQQLIRSTVSGPDLVIEAVDATAGCSGDLVRVEHADLRFGGGRPPFMPGVACPVTAPGDAAVRGTADGLYYYIQDASGFGVSNMAFRQEFLFEVGISGTNSYFVSMPLILGIPDLANTAAAESNKCVGDAGGPAAVDGILTADDLLCLLWTSRSTGQGSMLLAYRAEDVDAWPERTAFVDTATGNVEFAGAWTEELVPGRALLVVAEGAMGTQNRAVITGAHDPAWTGHPIAPGSVSSFLVSSPYHAMAAHADELLCGLEGIDWMDADGNGMPDTCPNGVYDGANIACVTRLDNSVMPGTSLYYSRCVRRVFGTDRFVGTRFDVVPGEAILINVSTASAPVTFLPPHY